MSGASASQRYDEAVRHHEAGRFAEATSLLCEVIAADPRHADALHRLGLVTFQAGSPEQAAALIEHALQISDSDPAAYFSLGTIQLSLGRAEAAVTSYRRAIALDPGHFPAHANLATTLNNLGRPGDALTVGQRAVLLNPGSADACNTLGLTLTALGKFDEAEAEFRHAVQIAPQSVDSLINLGNLCFVTGRYDEAVSCCEKAIALAPENVVAHSNLAGALRVLGRPADALTHYDRAIELDAAPALTRLNRAFLLLALGRFTDGWAAYEARFEMAPAKALPAPVWQGEDLAGRSILLTAEQGYGDTIQFCRYASLLAARGATVAISAPKPLVRLLATAPGVTRVIEDGAGAAPFDYSLPIMSAPLRFGTTLNTIPATIPYLRASEADIATWREELRSLPGLKVGLVWAGEPRNLADAQRSIRLAEFEPVLAMTGISAVSLQKGDAAVAEIGALPAELRPLNLMDRCHDFADSAALIETLDLVITVDTAAAHLAGALGKPVWILHRRGGCWRWLLEGDSSPWYPTARLFRQQQTDDWREVISQIAADLEILRKEKRQR